MANLGSVSINKVLFNGVITKEPEVKTRGEGFTLCQLHMEVDNGYKSKKGVDVQEKCRVQVEVWGATKEVAAHAKIGDMALIEGRMKQSSWQDDEGNTRTKNFIFADKFINLTDLSKGSPVSTAAAGTDDGNDDLPF